MAMGSSPAEYTFMAMSVVRESQEIRGPTHDPLSIKVQLESQVEKDA